MTESKFCKNHPSARAIASCDRCAIDLCGMCGSFIDSIVLCERCSENHETEKYVAIQSQKLERPESTLVIDAAVDAFTPATPKGVGKKIIQWGVIVVSFCIMLAQLLLYSNPAQVQQEPSAAAREQQLYSLVQCMLVFREIGLILESGRMPGNELRCADSESANFLSDEAGSIRFYHPNPQYYGYEEISIGNDTPEPRLVRGE